MTAFGWIFLLLAAFLLSEVNSDDVPGVLAVLLVATVGALLLYGGRR